MHLAVKTSHIRSCSEPVAELGPLAGTPRARSTMAEPIEYRDEKDKRLDSVSESGGLDSRSVASGSMSGGVVVWLPFLPCTVGVVSFAVFSSLTGSDFDDWLGDVAMDGFRGGTAEEYRCVMATDAGGGREIVARSTLPALVISGSDERLFL
jgi:hypothetical protein